MAGQKDTLRSGSLDAMRDGSVTGSAAKGYSEHAADGSEYDKFGNRIEYGKLSGHNFK